MKKEGRIGIFLLFSCETSMRSGSRLLNSSVY